MDDFAIAPPSAVPPQPLPMAAPPAAAQPPQVPQAPQPAGMNLRGSLPLLAVLPLIAKRFGPQGLAAALQGYEQGQQLKAQRGQQLFENQRQVANDQRSAQLQQQQEIDRQAQLRNQTLQQRTGFLDTARKSVEGMDDPDQLAAYQRYIVQAGQPYGITEQDLAPITTVPASTLQKRQATKKLGELEKAYTDAQRAQLEQAGTKFQIGGETLTLPEIRQRAGVAAFNAAGQSATVPVKPPTDEDATAPLDRRYLTASIAAFKQRTGRDPNPTEVQGLIRDAKKVVGTADDRPVQPREEPLVRIEETDEQGNTVITYKPRSEVSGKSFVKPASTAEPNQGQYQAGAFAGRMEQAEGILGPMDKAIAGMNYASFEGQRRLPSAAQSAQMQSYMQASRNFINAVLRRESGAAISAQEFVNAQQQYLPQPGDDDVTLQQKAANRQYVFTTMKKSAGRAYEPPPPPPLTKDAQIGHVYLYNGKKVRVREKNGKGFLFDEVVD